MNKLISALLISTAALSATAYAEEELCDVPKAEWQPQEALEQSLQAKGWEIRKVKVDEGCYEVYAKNEKGERVEAYFDPKSFEIVKMQD
ncbi:PepSY domain-containing protein [Marinobacterium sp. D7]|uniref:PepSY domain-containing protein n=1 Tax=Marinobacterium ramblicola TaxID=2849041 RepID=UPI001C2D0E7C|nr:PepSY domain-containing protein [Marinobacterium ramblicola]MBV1788471.1 PepSY domain-containing protein [Marinobacterium ramblicola]